MPINLTMGPGKPPKIQGAGWVVAVAALAPVIIKNAKPLAKKMAQGLIQAGEYLKSVSETEGEPVKEQPESQAADKKVAEEPQSAHSEPENPSKPTSKRKAAAKKKPAPARKKVEKPAEPASQVKTQQQSASGRNRLVLPDDLDTA